MEISVPQGSPSSSDMSSRTAIAPTAPSNSVGGYNTQSQLASKMNWKTGGFDAMYGSGGEYGGYSGNDGMYSSSGSTSQTSVGSISDIGCNLDYGDFGKVESVPGGNVQASMGMMNGYENMNNVPTSQIYRTSQVPMRRTSMYNPPSVNGGARGFENVYMSDGSVAQIDRPLSSSGITTCGDYTYAPYFSGSPQTAEQMQQAIFNAQLQRNMPQYMPGQDFLPMQYSYDPQMLNMLIMQANAYQSMEQNNQMPSTPSARMSNSNGMINNSNGFCQQNGINGMYPNPTHMYDPTTQTYSQQMLAQQYNNSLPNGPSMMMNSNPYMQRDSGDNMNQQFRNSMMAGNNPCGLRKAIKKKLPTPPGKEKDVCNGKTKRGLCCLYTN